MSAQPTWVERNEDSWVVEASVPGRPTFRVHVTRDGAVLYVHWLRVGLFVTGRLEGECVNVRYGGRQGDACTEDEVFLTELLDNALRRGWSGR